MEIEAIQFCGTTAETHAVYQWIEQNTLGSFEPMAVIEGREPPPASGVSIDPRDGRLIIATLEGLRWVDLDDYVIRGVKGEFYPCKPDTFAATYEAVLPLYGLWRVDDDPAKTGWISAHGGRVIVAHDPQELAQYSRWEVREYPPPILHAEWEKAELAQATPRKEQS